MPGPTGRYEQIQGGAACRLAFSVVLDSADKAARDSAGWDDCLDMLDQVVDGRTPERPYLSDNWRGYYEEHKRRGFPATAEIPQSDRTPSDGCHRRLHVAILCEVLESLLPLRCFSR